jgi:putative selenate reductase molybdopterin-binding subunit
MTITINGRAGLELGNGGSLAEALRARGLTGVKTGCDTGECGLCLVLLDGVAVRSCSLVSKDVVPGSNLLTVEGLDSAGVLHPIQRAFLDHGAVQCGFCTPSLLLAAKALLDRKRSPSEEDIRESLASVLCRCTGYQKPVDAILGLVNAGFPGNTLDTGASENFHRVDGRDLVRGVAAFTDDHQPQGMLYGKLLWSPHAHARILSIDTSEAAALPGVHAVLSWENTPRVPYTRACQETPEPSPKDTFLFDNKVRYVGDRVAAVAAESPKLADQALRLIRVEYEPLPALLDYRSSGDRPVTIIHDQADSQDIADPALNLCSSTRLSTGDSRAGFAEADAICAQSFQTQRVQHALAETHRAITWLDDNGRLIVRSGTQVPFLLRRQLALILERSGDSIQVLRPPIGGGFGSRQEVVVEDVCAALTIASGRPVRLVLTRHEEFVSTRCRHAMTIDLQIGYKKDGRLTAQRMDLLCDAGAYGSHSPTVCTNAVTKNFPRYPCPNVDFRARAVYTNTVVGGAFRGYGGPQGAFALESLIDELAHTLGKDPIGYRLEIGRTRGSRDRLSPLVYGPQQAIVDGWPPLQFDPLRCLSEGARKIDWEARRKDCEDWNRSDESTWRGLGVAFVSHGSGVAGHQNVGVRLRLAADGSFILSAESGEMGTGSNTTLIRLAAHSLGVTEAEIRLVTGDTDDVPYSSGAYASATTFLSAIAIEQAAKKLLEKIRQAASALMKVPPDQLESGPVGFTMAGCSLRRSTIASLRAEQGLGPLESEALGSSCDSPPPFAAQFAEVEVDRRSFEIRLRYFLSVVDAGRIVNRRLAEGQVDGAVAQGLGFALTEELVVNEDGSIGNPNFGAYRVLRADKLPTIETVLLDPGPNSDNRVRSIGEVGIDGPAPAVANAVFHATGARIRRLPIRPEDIRIALGLSTNPSPSGRAP